MCGTSRNWQPNSQTFCIAFLGARPATWDRSDFRRAAIWSPMVCRAKRNQLRKVFQSFTRCCDSRLRARGKPNCRRLGSGDSARKKDCFALSGGNRFVRPLLTASSVIAVMPACMLMVPNPGSRSEWPAHCDRGIHYVWPCKFGVVRVVVSTIAAHILRKQNEAAKQHH